MRGEQESTETLSFCCDCERCHLTRGAEEPSRGQDLYPRPFVGEGVRRTGEGSYSDKIAQQACCRRNKRVRSRFHPLLRLRNDSTCSIAPRRESKPSRGTNVVRGEQELAKTLSFRCDCERCRLLRGAVSSQKRGGKASNRQAAFTLTEVLITLGIIGVVAALVLPNLIANYREKELAVKAKKSYSDIQNAISLAQQDNGNIGDNSALFNYLDGYLKVTENFSKYFKGAMFCKNRAQCENFYYDIAYAAPRYNSSGNLKVYNPGVSKIILSNGTVLHLSELIQNCNFVRKETYYDKDGNSVDIDNNIQYCAIIHFDVNGAKQPNQFGKDVFSVIVYKDKIVPDKWAQTGGKALINILFGMK